jgi:hypothetical protein
MMDLTPQSTNSKNQLFFSIPLEPTSDLLFPDLYSLMVVGITFLEMSQKTLYYFASRREDGQTNQDK